MKPRISKRAIAQHLNALRQFAPDDRVPELLPVRAARSPSRHLEHDAQCRVIRWWDSHGSRAGAHFKYGLEEFCLYAVPNAALRSPALGAWMKAEGMRAGIPDLQLDVARDGFHGLRIEMKAGANKESDKQSEVLASLRRRGYKTMTCWTTDAAIDAIQDYLDRKPGH